MIRLSEVIGDELRYYLVIHYYYLMTKTEYRAYKRVHQGLSLSPLPMAELEASVNDWATVNDPEVRSLLTDGFHAFFVKVCDRMIREDSDKIFLNRCPRCSRLARTPKAKQCPHCFFSWHHSVISEESDRV